MPGAHSKPPPPPAGSASSVNATKACTGRHFPLLLLAAAVVVVVVSNTVSLPTTALAAAAAAAAAVRLCGGQQSRCGAKCRCGGGGLVHATQEQTHTHTHTRTHTHAVLTHLKRPALAPQNAFSALDGEIVRQTHAHTVDGAQRVDGVEPTVRVRVRGVGARGEGGGPQGSEGLWGGLETARRKHIPRSVA